MGSRGPADPTSGRGRLRLWVDHGSYGAAGGGAHRPRVCVRRTARRPDIDTSARLAGSIHRFNDLEIAERVHAVNRRQSAMQYSLGQLRYRAGESIWYPTLVRAQKGRLRRPRRLIPDSIGTGCRIAIPQTNASKHRASVSFEQNVRIRVPLPQREAIGDRNHCSCWPLEPDFDSRVAGNGVLRVAADKSAGCARLAEQKSQGIDDVYGVEQAGEARLLGNPVCRRDGAVPEEIDAPVHEIAELTSSQCCG